MDYIYYDEDLMKEHISFLISSHFESIGMVVKRNNYDQPNSPPNTFFASIFFYQDKLERMRLQKELK